jgi:hypothetical protein
MVDMVNPAGVKGTGAADDAVHFVAFGQQQFRQIGTILSGDSCNERFFHACFTPFRFYVFKTYISNHPDCILMENGGMGNMRGGLQAKRSRKDTPFQSLFGHSS